MQGIAEFHKVSFDQFLQDSKTCGMVSDETPDEIVKAIWERIKCPQRATEGSAGYDFYAPYPYCIQDGGTITMPTGIRADIQPGWCLVLVPRSSLGFMYGMRLENSLGIIDADYFYVENEGHILVRFSVSSNYSMVDGAKFVQGIFLPHGITRSDCTHGVRSGGFGSTGVV